MSRSPQRPRPRLPIGTARLLLREFAASDADALIGWSSDDRVTRHMPWGPRGETQARRHLDWLLQHQADPTRAAWELAITLADGGTVIGACDLSLVSPDVAEIGYLLARPHWGRGYATEVAGKLVRVAFEELGVARVDSTVDLGNRRSMQVLEKAGLRWQGTQRRHARVKGRWWDAHLYGVTREDWQQAGG